MGKGSAAALVTCGNAGRKGWWVGKGSEAPTAQKEPASCPKRTKGRRNNVLTYINKGVAMY